MYRKIAAVLVCIAMAATAFSVVTANPKPVQPASSVQILSDGYVPGTTWVKRGIVLDIGGSGQETQVTTPAVLKLADGTYAMWYMGKGPSGYMRIFKATSPDGLTWAKAGIAIDYGEPYAAVGVMYPFVRFATGGGYEMWYTSYDGSRCTRILKATSADGVTWTKLGPQLVYGSACDPDGVAAPRVYFDGAQWHMWYSACRWTPNRGWICHAQRATEADPWIKDGIVLANDTVLDSWSAGVQWILPTAGGYDMFYGGRGPDQLPGRILHAYSADGLAWTKTGLVLDRSLPGESAMVDYPSVIYENGVYRMWYVGYDGAISRIYYAETEAQSQEPVDLWVGSEDISYSTGEPIEGTPMEISATVHGDRTITGTTTQENLLFSDDFSSGNLAKWGLSQWNPCGLMEVSSAVSNSTPYSMHAQSNPGTNTGPYAFKRLASSYDHLSLESMVYLPPKAQQLDFWILLSSGNWSKQQAWDAGSNYEFYLVFDNDNYKLDILEIVLGADGAWDFYWGTYDFYEMTPSTWHDLRLDLSASGYAVYVDGSQVVSGQRQASTKLSAVLVGDIGGAGGGWGDMYWDDVKVYSVEEMAQTAHQGLDAVCDVAFYIDTVAPGNEIGRVTDLPVPHDGTAQASIDWLPVFGSHVVYASVENVVPSDSNIGNNLASKPISVAAAGPSDIVISKVKTSGIDTGYTFTYYEWVMRITVINSGDSDALDVVVRDVLPSEFNLLALNASKGTATSRVVDGSAGTRSLPPPPTTWPRRAAHIAWTVGTLAPGEMATLDITTCTKLNPAGKQEFTSPGTYSLNDGAWVDWRDSQTGVDMCAGPTPGITVDIEDLPQYVPPHSTVPGDDQISPPVEQPARLRRPDPCAIAGRSQIV